MDATYGGKAVIFPGETFFFLMDLWFLYVFVFTLCFQRWAQGAKKDVTPRNQLPFVEPMD